MLNNQNINTAIKRLSKIYWDLGYVNIEDKNITVASDSFTKRIKVYNNNMWTNTKPIIINEIDKSLTLYYHRSLIIGR